MRNTPATQALTSVRSISGRLTFTDYRLRFANLAASEDPTLYDLYADSDYGLGVLQVTHLISDPTTTLRWRYITNMAVAFPAWNTLTVMAAYHISMFSNRLFVSGAVSASYDFNGNGWAPTGVTLNGGATTLIAPVSLTDYYTLTSFAVSGNSFAIPGKSGISSFGFS